MGNPLIVWEESELKNISGFAKSDKLTSDNVKQFACLLIKNAATRTNVEYEEIVSLNANFFLYLEELSKCNKVFSVFSDEFKKLCSLLKVPVIKNNSRSDNIMIIGDVREKREEELLNYDSDSELLTNNLNETQEEEELYTHTDCLNLFNKLNPAEKLKFIMEFQNTEIKLTPPQLIAFKSC